MPVTRRDLLASLLALPSLAVFSDQSFASSAVNSSAFLDVSCVITGSKKLTLETANRIETLLRQHHAGFDSDLAKLHKALSGTATREEKLTQLDEHSLAFALAIAKPWYQGFVGTPSARILKDDAQFATFMEMQAYEKVADVIPRPSYPLGQAGWWQKPPEGVDASDLPKEAAQWTYQPFSNYAIKKPDPAWRAYAEGKYDTIEEAKAALAGNVQESE